MLKQKYIDTGKLKYVYRDFPLGFHKEAPKASEAANCAAEQGQYWQMHARIYGNQKAMAVPDLKAHAKALGLDMQGFERCLDSGKYAAEVQKDVADGQSAGVRGTPSFFIGLTDPETSQIRVLRSIRGAQPYAAFQAAIDSLLAEQGR